MKIKCFLICLFYFLIISCERKQNAIVNPEEKEDLVTIDTLLYSQSDVMQFFSMGFNARELIITIQDMENDNETYYDYSYYYYFYGYKDYSEAFISKDLIELNTGVPNEFYPNSLIRHKFDPIEYIHYYGGNNIDGYGSIVITVGWMGEEHKEENGKLVYWAKTDERIPYIISERIEQEGNNIIIHAKHKDGVSFRYKYYNISKKELLDIFLTRYIDLICDVNESINEYISTDELDDVLIPLLKGRTARELAIFRNCLFAIKDYKFSNKTWTDFFNMYLEGYNGKFTNDEVMKMFSVNEKKLLDLIALYENGK
jgi:hypothetical protein